MYQFEVRTPVLKAQVDNLSEVSRLLGAGAIEPREANARINVASNVRRLVETELRVRLAAPKLIEIESKLIERERAITDTRPGSPRQARGAAMGSTTSPGSPGQQREMTAD